MVTLERAKLKTKPFNPLQSTLTINKLTFYPMAFWEQCVRILPSSMSSAVPCNGIKIETNGWTNQEKFKDNFTLPFKLEFSSTCCVGIGKVRKCRARAAISLSNIIFFLNNL